MRGYIRSVQTLMNEEKKFACFSGKSEFLKGLSLTKAQCNQLIYTHLRGHATNSYGFTCKILAFIDLYFCSIPFYIRCAFVVLKNHHLQLEVLALRLSLVF